MVTSGDILQFTQFSVFGDGGNTGLNVFQYEVTGDLPFVLVDYGQDIINEWYNQQVVLLQPITSDLVAWTETHIVNLTNPTEIYVGISDDTSAGAVSGDCLPPYASWGFILRRTNATTRSGYKRFWGVPESLQLNGIPTAAAGLLLPGIADSLGAAMLLNGLGSPAIDVVLTPAIVRKDTAGALVSWQPVLDGQFRSIGTQNTRKFGRGM